MRYTKCKNCGKKGMRRHPDYQYMKKHGMQPLLPKKVCKYCKSEVW